MKLYSFYLPDDKICNSDFKEDYLFKSFLDTGFIDSVVDLPRVEIEPGRYYYLYAVTNDKKLAKSFEEIHNMRIFVKIVKDVYDDTFDNITEKWSMSILMDLTTNDKKGRKIKLVVTAMEMELLETAESIVENAFSYIASQVDYEVFKNKYIKALDRLLYCTYNKMHSVDGDDVAYNFSFGITAEGHVKNRVSLGVNILRIYYRVFSHLLK